MDRCLSLLLCLSLCSVDADPRDFSRYPLTAISGQQFPVSGPANQAVASTGRSQREIIARFGGLRHQHPFFGYHKYLHVGIGHKGKREAEAGPEPYPPRGRVFHSPRSGWIPLPHSHSLVRGSRPYLTGKRKFKRGEAEDHLLADTDHDWASDPALYQEPDASLKISYGADPYVDGEPESVADQYSYTVTDDEANPSIGRHKNGNKDKREAEPGPDPYPPRGIIFFSARTGWIPLTHSHSLVLGSRPYLTGHRRFRREGLDDQEAPEWYSFSGQGPVIAPYTDPDYEQEPESIVDQEADSAYDLEDDQAPEVFEDLDPDSTADLEAYQEAEFVAERDAVGDVDDPGPGLAADLGAELAADLEAKTTADHEAESAANQEAYIAADQEVESAADQEAESEVSQEAYMVDDQGAEPVADTEAYDVVTEPKSKRDASPIPDPDADPHYFNAWLAGPRYPPVSRTHHAPPRFIQNIGKRSADPNPDPDPHFNPWLTSPMLLPVYITQHPPPRFVQKVGKRSTDPDADASFNSVLASPMLLPIYRTQHSPHQFTQPRFRRSADPDPDPKWFNAWLAGPMLLPVYRTHHPAPRLVRPRGRRSADPYFTHGYQFWASHNGYIPKAKIHVPLGYQRIRKWTQ